MTPSTALGVLGDVAGETSVLARKPRQLLLAFFGEYVCDSYFVPLRASVVIGVL